MKGISSLGAMRPMRDYKPMAGMRSLADVIEDDEEKLESWIERVGEARAAEAEAIYKKRTGSTTLPELLVEASLSKRGMDYRAQVDLGWARPDFVVFGADSQGALVIRVQGDYWHTRSGAVANDAQQKERLEKYTVFGVPVARVIDVWERDIYESEAVLEREMGMQMVRADGDVVTLRESFAELVMDTPGLWGYWRFNDVNTSVARDETGAHPGSTGFSVNGLPGRKTGELARVTATVTPGYTFTDWTVEAWIRPQTPVTVVIAQFGGASSPTNRVWYRATVEGVFVTVNGVDATPALPLISTWAYVAARKIGAQAQVMVNGVAYGAVAVPDAATDSDMLRFGGVPVGAEYGGSLLLDDMAIYERAIELDEMESHYLAG